MIVAIEIIRITETNSHQVLLGLLVNLLFSSITKCSSLDFSGKIIILGLYPRMTIGAPKSFTNWRDNIRFYIVTIFIIISSKFLKMAFPINVIYEAFKPKVFTNRADHFFLHVYVNSNCTPNKS
jgi:hypothetical protein